MYKILVIKVHNGIDCYVDYYEFNSKLAIGDLRKDYWKGISEIGYPVGIIDLDKSNKDIDVYKLILKDDKLEKGYSNESIVRSSKVGNNRLLDIMIGVDMCIVSPDWEDKNFKLYYKNNEVIEIESSVKDCSRYTSTFLF